MSRRSTPEPVAGALRAVVAASAPVTPLGAVQSVWAQAVGERIAAQASPLSERDGELTVNCLTATWAHELDMLGERLRGKLNAALAEAGGREDPFQVTALRFVVDRA